VKAVRGCGSLLGVFGDLAEQARQFGLQAVGKQGGIGALDGEPGEGQPGAEPAERRLLLTTLLLVESGKSLLGLLNPADQSALAIIYRHRTKIGAAADIQR
jgi:hypothetical protein